MKRKNKLKKKHKLKLDRTAVETIVQAFLMGISILAILLATKVAGASEINKYDMRGDKTKIVIEYCDSENVCDKLVIDKKFADTDEGQKALKKWLDDRIDERLKRGEEP
jgi:hypothetical protein